MIDYEVLRFIWWLLVGVLLIGFAVTDGFDMGVGMLTRSSMVPFSSIRLSTIFVPPASSAPKCIIACLLCIACGISVFYCNGLAAPCKGAWHTSQATKG